MTRLLLCFCYFFVLNSPNNWSFTYWLFCIPWGIFKMFYKCSDQALRINWRNFCERNVLENVGIVLEPEKEQGNERQMLFACVLFLCVVRDHNRKRNEYSRKLIACCCDRIKYATSRFHLMWILLNTMLQEKRKAKIRKIPVYFFIMLFFIEEFQSD